MTAGIPRSSPGSGPERGESPSTGVIDRREAIRRVSMLLGGIAFVGGDTLLAACSRERPVLAATLGIGDFTLEDIAFLDEVADTILPETSTPGAKAAQTGAFMALMVTDTYDARDQQVFREGLRMLEETSRDVNGVPFMAASPEQRLRLLERLDREQRDYMRTRQSGAPAHYFRMMKELALLGYFTSEIGCRQAQRYVESPGRFEPCLPYEPGERSWV